MVRAILSAIVSFFMPGFGHIFINFQILKGILVVLLFIVLYFIIFIISIIGSSIGLILNLLIPLAHISIAYIAYKDCISK